MLKNTKEKKKGEWVYWEINQKGYSDICGYLDWETLCQSTGLLDSKGVEIYEGDIVKVIARWHDGQVENCISEIEWRVDHFGGYYRWDWNDKNKGGEFYLGVENKHVEIIGNTFDNPELLK